LAARPQVPGTPPSSDRLLFRSRFGRRLLAIFLGCALVPTLLIGMMSYRSVRTQLVEQAQEHLAVLTQFTARIIHDRLTMLEADFVLGAAILEADAPSTRPPASFDKLYPLMLTGMSRHQGNAEHLMTAVAIEASGCWSRTLNNPADVIVGREVDDGR